MHEDDLSRRVSQPLVDHRDLPRRATGPSERQSKIVNGIEFFHIGDVEDCQCARCGSSCCFLDCDNCGGEGDIESDDWQDEEGYRYRCDWCMGKGGWWRCISSKAFCEANPMPGRADQPVMGCEAHEYD